LLLVDGVRFSFKLVRICMGYQTPVRIIAICMMSRSVGIMEASGCNFSGSRTDLHRGRRNIRGEHGDTLVVLVPRSDHAQHSPNWRNGHHDDFRTCCLKALTRTWYPNGHHRQHSSHPVAGSSNKIPKMAQHAQNDKLNARYSNFDYIHLLLIDHCYR
jgi:hypothetical protein